MARVWKSSAFRESLERKYPGESQDHIAEHLRLEPWELDALLANQPPRGAALAPHRDEIRLLERQTSLSSTSEGGVVEDSDVVNRGIEESYRVLQAEPDPELKVRWRPRDSAAQRELFARFHVLAKHVWICGLGQRIRFVEQGIRFLALDSFGIQAYKDAGANAGLDVRSLDLWEHVTIPRARRWLRNAG